MNKIKFHLIIKETKNIIRKYWFMLGKYVLLMGFLFLLLNIFAGTAIYSQKVNENIREKLWLYVYINNYDDISTEYKEAIQIKEEIEKYGIEVSFISKDDALKSFEKTMPNIKKNLQKFNIDNPLYSTLYIKISDKDNYKTIKNILNENKDKIQNYEDFDIDNFNSQEQRSIQTITVSNFIQKVIITFSIILILIIILFITHIIYSLYKHFEKDLSSKKMLWVDEYGIIGPFIMTNILVIIWSLLLWLISYIIIITLLSLQTKWLIDNNISTTFLHSFQIRKTLILEIIIALLWTMIISYAYLHKLEWNLK